MSSKIDLQGLKTFKDKLDAKFSLKGHTHTDYVTSSALTSATVLNATNSTKATQDASGNVITTTYATKTELNSLNTDDGDIDTSSITGLFENETTGEDTTTEYYTKTEIDAIISTVYKYKGTVTAYEDLPTSGQVIGDVYNVNNTGANYAWNGTGWDKLSETIDLSGYVTTSSLASVTVAKATSADSATKATQDGDGNVISTTYAKTVDLATVATSGSYNDLTNKPTIPTITSGTTDLTENTSALATGTIYLVYED